MRITTKRKNPGYFENLKKRLSDDGGMECAIGFPRGTEAENKGADGASAIDKAVWNNFGTGRIPPRPFMDLASPAIAKAWKTAMANVKSIQSLDIKKVLEATGIQGQGLVQVAIDETNEPPNALSTRKKKLNKKAFKRLSRDRRKAMLDDPGSTKPLVDDGEMRQSATYLVRKKSD